MNLTHNKKKKKFFLKISLKTFINFFINFRIEDFPTSLQYSLSAEDESEIVFPVVDFIAALHSEEHTYVIREKFTNNTIWEEIDFYFHL
mgnify:CR=1 FL=1